MIIFFKRHATNQWQSWDQSSWKSGGKCRDSFHLQTLVSDSLGPVTSLPHSGWIINYLKLSVIRFLRLSNANNASSSAMWKKTMQISQGPNKSFKNVNY